MSTAAVSHAQDFDSAGIKIHYSATGEGDPVILIHGLASSARMNWDIPGITAKLAHNHQVITLDCRGHGRSDKPEAEGAYGTNMVEDVVRLMDHLHIAKARIVGYSMGSMIAMKLAVLHPERVSAIVLGGMGWHQANAPMNHFWESTGNGLRLLVPPACPHGFPELAVTEAELKAVKIPVTVIVGDQDPCRHMYVEPLQKVRPDWPVHIIPDAGHLSCVIKPEFLKQLEAALP
jgi:pimeloyl-ACP methyl ester carboxylesterase